MWLSRESFSRTADPRWKTKLRWPFLWTPKWAALSAAKHSDRNLRRSFDLFSLVLFLLSCVVLGGWAFTTYHEVRREVRHQLKAALDDAAIPVGLFFADHEAVLREIEWGSLVNEQSSKPLPSESLTQILGHWRQAAILESDGRVGEQWAAIPLPGHSELMSVLAQATEERRTVLSTPYNIDGTWFATIARQTRYGESAKFVAASFPIRSLLEWWSGLVLPTGAKLTLVTEEGRLWVQRPQPDGSDDTSLDIEMLFDVVSDAERASGSKVFADDDGGLKPEVVTWKALDHFSQILVATLSADDISLIWRKRFLTSWIFAAAACLALQLATFLIGRSVVREARNREAMLQAVSDSEERLRDIANAASDWFWEMGADLSFTYVSDRVRDATGMDPSSFIGHKVFEVLDPAIDPAAAQTHMEDLARYAGFREFTYRIDLSDGHLRWIKLSGKPRFDADGLFLGYRGTGTDITVERMVAEHAAAAQARLTRAIESSSDGVTLFDSNERLILCNRRFRELFFPGMEKLVQPGASFTDIAMLHAKAGRNLEASKHPRSWVAKQARLRAKNESHEIRLDGDRWIRAEHFRTPEGDTISLYSDITPFKRREKELMLLAAENTRLAAAVTATEAGVIISDPQRPGDPTIFVNPAFTRLTGYEPGDVLGKNCWFLQGPETDPATLETLQRGLKTHNPVRVDIMNYRKDSSKFWSRLVVNPVFDDDGAVLYHVGVHTDISEQKRVESELVETKEHAEVANRAKSDFLAVMSHELRTPLNAVIGFSEFLSMEMLGPLGNKRYKSYADDIKSSGLHLLDLINDILDLSKAEADKIELHDEPLDLAATAEHCLAMVRSRAELANVTLINELPAGLPPLMADERRIKQILINLLSNAVKFTPADGTIRVFAQNYRGRIKLVVEDTGIGIAASDIPKVLKPFGQVDSTVSREHEGTGLGLPLCKRLAELHGAVFKIDSEPGKGTSISVVFPAQRILQREAA
ncbi:PAS domain S-box protein [Pelagibius sp. Alg239-R121]|uniref:PAS domain-containing sensor histidine kinase n=1 Tax=Pelagibius sp. Alg239-R121 TaxID=2993448 RepID=UPI0024A6135A|nr:PAS domain S-box protein [Pelagibius sp. Alg239-R121]